MKKVLLNLTLILLSVMAISSCDNGFADVDVIDTPPTITLGSITSGTTEGQDFKIKIRNMHFDLNKTMIFQKK